MNRSLEKLRRTSAKISEFLTRDPRVSSVILFGSGAYGVVSNRSDIDLEVVCNPEIPSRADRETLLSQIAPDWEIHAYGFENSPFPTIDTHRNVDGIKVEVHYQTAKWIDAVVTAVVEHGATTMALCSHRPYTVPALIQRGLVLFDRENFAQKWREESREYPPNLKQNILVKGIPSLQNQMISLKALIQKKSAVVDVRNIQRNQRNVLYYALDALTTVLFAINEIYDPAQNHIEETVFPELTTIPDRLIERWKLIQTTEWPDSVAAFIDLANDVLDLTKSHLSKHPDL